MGEKKNGGFGANDKKRIFLPFPPKQKRNNNKYNNKKESARRIPNKLPRKGLKVGKHINIHSPP